MTDSVDERGDDGGEDPVVQARHAQQLQDFLSRQQLIRDRTRSVCGGFAVGCYFSGRPGTSKTWTVKDELSKSGKPFIIKNARMTSMGLFDFMRQHSEHVIVLDDIPSLIKDRLAVQILLAALDGKPGHGRKVDYKSKDRDEFFFFGGGIIAISNMPLASDPMARALESRMLTLEHEPTDDEIAAVMRELAKKGHESLTPEKCAEVVEFVIAETRCYQGRLDLRHFAKALQDRVQWEADQSLTHWQDLVRSSLRQPVFDAAGLMTQRQKVAHQRQRVAEAMQKFPGDSKRQIEFTGLKPSTFYVRRNEVEHNQQ